jgi:lipopolysaccharide export system protein LptA
VFSAAAQPLDLSHGGPITITARDGIEWHQTEQEVIALGDAHATRANVTVVADRLTAYYRKKAAASAPAGQTGVQPAATQPPAVQPAGAQPPGAQSSGAQSSGAQPSGAQSGTATDADTSGTEIFRLRAEGNVQIFTTTDHAQGDLAVYDIDQAVLVMTGHDLKLTTPSEILTARDTLEYWPQKHMSVARGNAVVVTKDARRVAADVLVAYTSDTDAPQAGQGAGQGPNGRPAAPPARSASTRPAVQPASTTPPAASGPGQSTSDDLAASGKIEKVEAFGHVSVRTPTDTAIGDRAVYVPDTGIARLAGHVHITRGQNQLSGQEAEVNMKTGISRLLRGNSARVSGLVEPNDASNRSLMDPTTPAAVRPPAQPAGGARTDNPATPANGSHP